MPLPGWSPSPAQRSLSIANPADPFITEGGETIAHVTLAYETWGRLSPARDNVVLVFHALTGDSHAASHPDLPGDRPGWWEDLVGPGRPVDTERLFVVCANALGSCYGSTGPRSLAPDGRPYNLRFPALSVRDLVNANLRLLQRLGIQRVHCAIGGSLGGMQALEFAVLAGRRVERIVCVAASGRFHAQGIAYNEVQRRAIMLDPLWDGGNYPDDAPPLEGIAVARMLGMLTYQSDEAMSQRFGRHAEARYRAWPEFQGRYDIEGYLHYQGDKLARRFDANTYLYLSRVMDSHDLGRARGGLDAAAASISAEVLLLGVRSDILFPPGHVLATADALARAGVAVRYRELNSPHGHDAFLKEFDRLDAVLRDAIGRPPCRTAAPRVRARDATAAVAD